MPLEGGFLKINENELDGILKSNIGIKKFIRSLVGGDEFLKGYLRYAFWIPDKDLQESLNYNIIAQRVSKVKTFRLNGGEVARSLVNRSHQFRYTREAVNNFILIPCTSSEKREYLTCGFFDKKYISLNSAQIIYDSEPYIFALVSSKMHLLWSKSTAGTLESRLRYSTQLCYNTFPIPSISNQRKEELTQCTLKIIDERLKHSEKSIAQLYDPDKMPEGLKEAHHQNDLAVERCYRSTPFNSDEERLEYLFKLYEKMIQEEKDKDTLFAKEKKTRKRK
jgi:hypothetical protein